MGCTEYLHSESQIVRKMSKKVRNRKGSYIRYAVLSIHRGQDVGGVLLKAVVVPLSVPYSRQQLQPSGEGVALPFLREKGNGVALQVGAMHERACNDYTAGSRANP